MTERRDPQNCLLRLLLVDDEEGFVDVLAKRLALRKIAVIKALSGLEAIEILREQSFDLAVLDIKMEDMDGIETLKRMKEMAPGMPVILLTGHGSEQTAREGIALGALDYLTKPAELDELLSKIRQAAGLSG